MYREFATLIERIYFKISKQPYSLNITFKVASRKANTLKLYQWSNSSCSDDGKKRHIRMFPFLVQMKIKVKSTDR